MLPRDQRLSASRDIAAVRRLGSSARAGDLRVTVLRGTSAPAVRASVVVSRRAGGAVVRNRQRRRLQHLLPAVLPTLPAGTDVLVSGGPAVDALSPARLRSDLGRTVARAYERAAR